jgi:transcriptional regulator with XRE-family HTH domain
LPARKGLTEIGISQNSLSTVEHGEVEIGAEILLRIGREFGESIAVSGSKMMDGTALAKSCPLRFAELALRRLQRKWRKPYGSRSIWQSPTQVLNVKLLYSR